MIRCTLLLQICVSSRKLEAVTLWIIALDVGFLAPDHCRKFFLMLKRRFCWHANHWDLALFPDWCLFPFFQIFVKWYSVFLAMKKGSVRKALCRKPQIPASRTPSPMSPGSSSTRSPSPLSQQTSPSACKSTEWRRQQLDITAENVEAAFEDTFHKGINNCWYKST